MRTYSRPSTVLLPVLLPVALFALSAGCYSFDDVPTIDAHYPEADSDGIPDVPAPSADSPVDAGALDGDLPSELPEDAGQALDGADAPSDDGGDASVVTEEDTAVSTD